MSIRLIVGLGNPGERYRETRHNVGFWLVDRLAARGGEVFRPEAKFFGELARLGADCRLLRPTTFMNHSGRAVAAVAGYFDISPGEILVVHDELDLPAGGVKLKLGGGHAGHNGLRDTIAALGSREFARLRIGIDHPRDRRQVVDYVLGRPSRDEQIAIERALDACEAALPEILAGEFQRAMHRLHSD